MHHHGWPEVRPIFGKKKTTKLRGNEALEARSTALTGPAAQAAPEGVDTNAVWLAGIETVMPEAAIAYTSQADGTAAAYYSSGMAFPHLGDVDALATASTAFVEASGQMLDRFGKVDSLPDSERGQVRLYARQGDDTYIVQALEDMISAGGHPLSPLYKHARNVAQQAQLTLSR